MNLKPIDSASIPFAFECIKALRGDAEYGYEAFSAYIERNFLKAQGSDHTMLIASKESIPMGILTCNRFLMPRYLGFGYELEEVIVDKNHKNRGYGTEMIHAFFEYVKEQSDYSELRKIIVKTNDKVIAFKLYQKLFDETENTVYAQRINNL